MPQAVFRKHSKPRVRRAIMPATMPRGTEEKQHRSDRHHRRDGLLGMRNTVWSPLMTPQRDACRPTFFGKLCEGQREEHLELGMWLRNGVNDVIAMQRLGRFPRSNLDGLSQGELVQGAVRL